MTAIKLYIEDIAAYNNGSLHGCWIDCADGYDECMSQIQGMLERSPEAGAEEWQVSDTDTELENADRYSLKELCEFVDEAGDMLYECILYANNCGGDLTDMVSEATDAYIGDYDSFDEFAESLADETMEIPESIQPYFDYKRFARDLAHDYFIVDGHIFSNH